MNSLWTIIKGLVLDKGAKIAAGGGAVAILMGLFDRLQGQAPANFCFTIDATGSVLLIAGVLVWVAFKSDPPKWGR